MALIVLVSVAPAFVGYLVEPPGLRFTGAPTYAADAAQHEAWAMELATQLRVRNLLTPEPTPVGWFFTPLELAYGLVQRASGIPYAVVSNAFALVCAPALAVSLLSLARRAGLARPGLAAVIALLAGSFAPIFVGLARLGLYPGNPDSLRSAGGDATPVFAGPGPYLLLAVLALLALPTGETRDPARGFRRSGAVLFILGTIYPFFVPALLLAAGLCAALWARDWGWRRALGGLAWCVGLALLPMLYWAALPLVDSEYARFAAADRLPLYSPVTVLVSLGLGSGALIGIPRLLRANAYQQMLGCCAVALVLVLYVPPYPWRSHLFYLSPVLVIAALAAWWPVVVRLPRGRRWLLTGGSLAAAMLSLPYYYSRNLDGLAQTAPPSYLTRGATEAIAWLADQPGDDVVLARSDVSPWIAARAHHRVVVGHYLWTHHYEDRLRAVDAVFEGGVDPRPLLQAEQVAWVLIDEDRGAPAWVKGIEPAAQFGQTVVLRADQLLVRPDTAESPSAR